MPLWCVEWKLWTILLKRVCYHWILSHSVTVSKSWQISNMLSLTNFSEHLNSIADAKCLRFTGVQLFRPQLSCSRTETDTEASFSEILVSHGLLPVDQSSNPPTRRIIYQMLFIHWQNGFSVVAFHMKHLVLERNLCQSISTTRKMWNTKILQFSTINFASYWTKRYERL